MHDKLTRRTFLKSAAVGTALATVAIPRNARAQKAIPPAQNPAPETTSGLTAYELGPQIWVRFDNRLLTAYRAHRSQKYPYCFPLSGPVSGLSLTDETALPYPHHRSLFFGCDRVNGGNYWQEGFEQGQILSRGPKLAQAAREEVVITDVCDWQKPGGPVILRDERTLRITVPAAAVRILECAITLTAVEAVAIQKTNHSWFALRAALDITPRGGGQLVNAEGLPGEKATAGVKSAWCAFYGPRAALPGVVEGIALLDHPKNPWAPTPWFTRDYGFASPTPLNFITEPWQLPAGQSRTFRYAVVLFAGDPKAANLAGIYRDWAAKPA
jgi:hypothetical protein